jgi:hypothetical protein
MELIDFELEEQIRKNEHLMNQLAWEVEHGTAKRPEEAVRNILRHPKRNRRFQKLYSQCLADHGLPDKAIEPANETDPLTFAALCIISELRDWEV